MSPLPLGAWGDEELELGFCRGFPLSTLLLRPPFRPGRIPALCSQPHGLSSALSTKAAHEMFNPSFPSREEKPWLVETHGSVLRDHGQSRGGPQHIPHRPVPKPLVPQTGSTLRFLSPAVLSLQKQQFPTEQVFPSCSWQAVRRQPLWADWLPVSPLRTTANKVWRAKLEMTGRVLNKKEEKTRTTSGT